VNTPKFWSMGFSNRNKFVLVDEMLGIEYNYIISGKTMLNHAKSIVCLDSNALLTVVAFCKKGVHRSVAFAHLLRKVVGAYSKAESAASQMPIDILVQEFDMIHVSELGVNLGSHLITKNAHIPLSSTKNIFTAIRCFHGHSHCRLQFHVFHAFHGHSTFFHGQMHTFSRPNLVFTAIS